MRYKAAVFQILLCVILVFAVCDDNDSSDNDRDTHSKSWGEAELIEFMNFGDAKNPQIAMDPNGNAIAVWQEDEGPQDNIRAIRYRAATGLGADELIEIDDAGDAAYPQVCIDSNGNAIAVWRQYDGVRENIWANRYTPVSGWGMAGLIEFNTGSANNPQVACDSSGNTIAVWHQHDGMRYNIWANRYTPVSGWGTADIIDTEDFGSATNPQIACDSSGNAIAVWYQHDGDRYNVWARRYAAGLGWESAITIETSTQEAMFPQVSFDPDGNAIAVWFQYDGVRYNIWTNRYTSGIGWGSAELLELINTGSADKQQIAIDSNGNAVAVWQQNDGVRNNIMANRYTSGIGWGTAELIETDNIGHALDPQIAFDASGNAIAVWRQSDGMRYNIWANRYKPGAGWGSAELIETNDAGDASNPQIAMNPNGNAIAVWQQDDGVRYNIWLNRFE